MFSVPLRKIAMNAVHYHISGNPCICEVLPLMICFWFSINKPALLARPRSNCKGLYLARVQPRPYSPSIQLHLGNDRLTNPSPPSLHGVVTMLLELLQTPSPRPRAGLKQPLTKTKYVTRLPMFPDFMSG